mgnify:CR=1 FL=1
MGAKKVFIKKSFSIENSKSIVNRMILIYDALYTQTVYSP